MESEGTPKRSYYNNGSMYFAGICIAILSGMGLIVAIQSFIQMRDTLNLIARALSI